MTEPIHFLDCACHDESTVWCQDPDESSAGWQKALSVDLVTCLKCLQAVENVATRALAAASAKDCGCHPDMCCRDCCELKCGEGAED